MSSRSIRDLREAASEPPELMTVSRFDLLDLLDAVEAARDLTGRYYGDFGTSLAGPHVEHSANRLTNSLARLDFSTKGET